MKNKEYIFRHPCIFKCEWNGEDICRLGFRLTRVSSPFRCIERAIYNKYYEEYEDNIFIELLDSERSEHNLIIFGYYTRYKARIGGEIEDFEIVAIKEYSDFEFEEAATFIHRDKYAGWRNEYREWYDKYHNQIMKARQAPVNCSRA